MMTEPRDLAAMALAGADHPTRTSLRCSGTAWTRTDLLQQAQVVYDALRPHVPDRGGVVAVAHADPAHFVAAVLGAWRANCAVALATPTFGRAEIDALRTHLRPVAVLADAGFAALWSDSSGDVATPPTVVPFADERRLIRADDAEGRPGLAVVKFSSGSTGVPKMVGISAGQVRAAVGIVTDGLVLTPADVIWCPVPVHHSYGFDLGVLPMLFAGTTLVAERATVPRRFWTDLAGYAASIVLGVPSLYRAVLKSSATRPPDMVPPRWLISCTAPLPAYTAQEFLERHGVALCQHYGSSETGAVALETSGPEARRPGSVGRAMPGVTIRIVDEQGVDYAEGVVGRVCVQSDGVATGYLAGAPAGPSPFLAPGGRFLMGDRAMVVGGELCLEGRVDDLINIGGLKVSPAEVIAVLERHPDVDEAAVTGVTDANGEQWVYAMVASTQEMLAEAALLDWCRSQLADFKVPRRIDVRAALPRAHSGKVRLSPSEIDRDPR